MTIDVTDFEVFLLILVRITAFIYVAPFFSLRNVPQRVKVGFSLFFAIILFQSFPLSAVPYESVIGFSTLVIREAVAGLTLGFFTNISYYILSFSGHMMDMEIGFSMVHELDPITNIQTTITSNYYSYVIMLLMLVTNLHYYIIMALADTFKLIPLGGANINPNLFKLLVQFMVDYFIIGFRIILPVFAATLIVNVILAILAKVAPQINMFVIGLQLKVLIGLITLLLIVGFLPAVADFIFDEMISMMRLAIEALR
ncbi:MAG: flagellar biosynthetic protein FliR [Anaerocolumna sp.]|jgi:flagellar biosynthetic protein FliR|nr:flagellar biosynthetic protein FliR [Anaerocolumna sp.]